MALAVTFIFSVLAAWLIVWISRGGNWARWTMIALIALGWILAASDPAAIRAQGELALALDGVTFCLELYGSYLILTGEGVRWFRKTVR